MTRCLFKQLTAFVNVNSYVFASPRASISPYPAVDICTVRSKTVFLGRQQLYAVPARSTAALRSTSSVDSTGSDFGITPVVIHTESLGVKPFRFFFFILKVR